MREEKAVTEKKKHKCPPHHFVIDSDNVGHCRYCPEVRDFRKLWEKEERRIWKDPRAGGGKRAAVTILSVMKSMAK